MCFTDLFTCLANLFTYSILHMYLCAQYVCLFMCPVDASVGCDRSALCHSLQITSSCRGPRENQN